MTNIIDSKDFRRALSQFATGVTVITTQDEDNHPVGVTASSFNSVSMDPPLVLWSIDKSSNSLPAFESAEHFAVNVLNEQQVDVSNNFARRGSDKFSTVEYRKSGDGSPLLEDYVAQFECNTWAKYEGGDHLIIVGEVVNYCYKDTSQPLIFTRGSYASPVQLTNSNDKVVDDIDANSRDFIPDYLLYLLRQTLHGFSTELYSTLKKECDTTPDEWRVLARMSSHQTITIESLAPMVLQPEVALYETANRMVDMGLISYVDQHTLAITQKGLNLARRIQAVALTTEAEMLKDLPDETVRELKSNLKTLSMKL